MILLIRHLKDPPKFEVIIIRSYFEPYAPEAANCLPLNPFQFPLHVPRPPRFLCIFLRSPPFLDSTADHLAQGPDDSHDHHQLINRPVRQGHDSHGPAQGLPGFALGLRAEEGPGEGTDEEDGGFVEDLHALGLGVVHGHHSQLVGQQQGARGHEQVVLGGRAEVDDGQGVEESPQEVEHGVQEAGEGIRLQVEVDAAETPFEVGLV